MNKYSRGLYKSVSGEYCHLPLKYKLKDIKHAEDWITYLLKIIVFSKPNSTGDKLKKYALTYLPVYIQELWILLDKMPKPIYSEQQLKDAVINTKWGKCYENER